MYNNIIKSRCFPLFALSRLKYVTTTRTTRKIYFFNLILKTCYTNEILFFATTNHILKLYGTLLTCILLLMLFQSVLCIMTRDLSIFFTSGANKNTKFVVYIVIQVSYTKPERIMQGIQHTVYTIHYT